MSAASARHRLRRLAERGLARGGIAFLRRRSLGASSLILAYHNVVPDGASPGADESLHLSRARFGRQLDLLLEYCRVVPLFDILGVPARAAVRDRRPTVAITFDDAYRGALTAGLAELELRRLPATVFVAPETLGSAFWWDEYLNVDADARRACALNDCQGRGSRVREFADANGWVRTRVPEHAQAVSLPELEAVARRPQLTLGSHTWSHPALSRLECGPLVEELTRSRNWLEARFSDVALPVVAYPYGVADDRVGRAARAAGYEAGLRVQGGWFRGSPEDLFQIPRLNVPSQVSDDGFLLRISGLLAR